MLKKAVLHHKVAAEQFSLIEGEDFFLFINLTQGRQATSLYYWIEIAGLRFQANSKRIDRSTALISLVIWPTEI